MQWCILLCLCLPWDGGVMRGSERGGVGCGMIRRRRGRRRWCRCTWAARSQAPTSWTSGSTPGCTQTTALLHHGPQVSVMRTHPNTHTHTLHMRCSSTPQQLFIVDRWSPRVRADTRDNTRSNTHTVTYSSTSSSTQTNSLSHALTVPSLSLASEVGAEETSWTRQRARQCSPTRSPPSPEPSPTTTVVLTYKEPSKP
eukprot:2979594-Rhodomonas_salina.1